MKSKVELHVNLHDAYAKLLRLCLLLDLDAYYKDLQRGRLFMSNMVDRSDYPKGHHDKKSKVFR